MQVSVCNVFKEVTLGMTVDEFIQAELQEAVAYMKERDYRQTCSNRHELLQQ